MGGCSAGNRPRAAGPIANRRARLIGSVAVVAALLGGCGPARYIYTVTYRAERSIARAKAIDAEKRAPYEYWSAVVNLRMAREKAGEADWELAHKYGSRAVKMSEAAWRVARGRKWSAPKAMSDKSADGSGPTGR